MARREHGPHRRARAQVLASGLLVLSALTALLPSAAAGAADPCDGADHVSQPAILCGTTTISGASTGYALVRVPAGGAILHDDRIRIEGTGDFVGFALTHDPPYLTAPNCRTTEEGQPVRLCATGSIEVRGLLAPTFAAPSRRVAMGSVTPPCAPRCVLAEGVYRLYLLADDGPASVTIEFPGLPGSVDLAPTHLVHFDARQPDPTVPTPSNPLFSAGFTSTLPTPGLLFAVEGAKVPAHAASEFGNCYYLDDPGDPRLAYQPRCPGWVTGGTDTLSGASTVIVPGVNQWWVAVGLAWPFRAGKAGVGGYIAVAGAVERASVAAFQLAFDPSA